MKKNIIASAIMVASAYASAMEISVTTVHDNSGTGNAVSLMQQVGKLGMSGSFERSSATQDRYGVGANYNVLTVGNMPVVAKMGALYLQNKGGVDGYAMTVGVGASLPITKTVSLTADVIRQYGQERVDQFNGTRTSVGLKHSF